MISEVHQRMLPVLTETLSTGYRGFFPVLLFKSFLVIVHFVSHKWRTVLNILFVSGEMVIFLPLIFERVKCVRSLATVKRPCIVIISPTWS